MSKTNIPDGVKIIQKITELENGLGLYKGKGEKLHLLDVKLKELAQQENKLAEELKNELIELMSFVETKRGRIEVINLMSQHIAKQREEMEKQREQLEAESGGAENAAG